jgi:hypothetical protein
MFVVPASNRCFVSTCSTVLDVVENVYRSPISRHLVINPREMSKTSIDF